MYNDFNQGAKIKKSQTVSDQDISSVKLISKTRVTDILNYKLTHAATSQNKCTPCCRGVNKMLFNTGYRIKSTQFFSIQPNFNETFKLFTNLMVGKTHT